MKISHRLIALSGFSAAGLLCVAGVSYVAVTSIQSDLRSLTLHATPLQTKSFEMQERTERMMGSLLRLSLAHTKDDAQKATEAISAEMQAIAALREQIRQLDPTAATDLGEFQTAQADISRAVDKRLADARAYQSETDNATAALKKAEAAVLVTRQSVNQIGIDAGRAADTAQDATRRLANAMKLALQAQSKLKEIAIVVSEVDVASNRFRLPPLKEKLKSAIDSLQRLEGDKADKGSSEKAGDDVLKETRVLVAGLADAFGKDNTGLLALRANVLAAKPETKADTDAAYQKQRKAILGPIDEVSAKLNGVVDANEVQAFKQRQTLEAALKLRNEPGGVVATSEAVSLSIRDMVGSLRLLMLAGSEAEAATSTIELNKTAIRLNADLAVMREGLMKMGRPPLAQNVDAALAAMASVSASIEKVSQAKKSLLASEAQMATSMAQLKAVAARQASAGQAQAKTMAERQNEVSAAVDARVQSSLTVILGIAALIIAATAVLSWRTVRIVTRRLDAAVQVAEAVSRGELVAVPAERGNDETTRLMAALASMVGTLTGIVTHIRGAADQINTGSTEISRGNRDLSERTEQQAGRLQQTASSVEQLNATVRTNADAARQATGLASGASEVASRGGEVVGRVVHTMQDIQQSSQQIVEIVSVIDGIAFQTNILALNAAVEAARAGEHGRGFAVVASEVRLLAKKSAEAAQQVKAIITSSVGKIETGSALVQTAGTTMADIVAQVRKVSELIGDIAKSSQEQSASVGEVSATVNSLDEMTQRNAALAEQGTAAAMSLTEQAQALGQAISVFKLPETKGSYGAPQRLAA